MGEGNYGRGDPVKRKSRADEESVKGEGVGVNSEESGTPWHPGVNGRRRKTPEQKKHGAVRLQLKKEKSRMATKLRKLGGGQRDFLNRIKELPSKGPG